MIPPYKVFGRLGTTQHTVDGRNHAPVDRQFSILFFTGFYTSQVVVWDFLHQASGTPSLIPCPSSQVIVRKPSNNCQPPEFRKLAGLQPQVKECSIKMIYYMLHQLIIHSVYNNQLTKSQKEYINTRVSTNPKPTFSVKKYETSLHGFFRFFGGFVFFFVWFFVPGGKGGSLAFRAVISLVTGSVVLPMRMT